MKFIAHSIQMSDTYTVLSVVVRIKKVNELKLWKICLRRHDKKKKKKCLSRYCLKCAKPRNTLLHLASTQNKGK